MIKELALERCNGEGLVAMATEVHTDPTEPPVPGAPAPEDPEIVGALPEESMLSEDSSQTTENMENIGETHSIESLQDAEKIIEKTSIEKERLSVMHREKIYETKKKAEEEVHEAKKKAAEEISSLKREIDSLRLNYTLEYFLNKSAVDELGYDSAKYYQELQEGTFVASQNPWYDFFSNRLRKLNYVLPALRVSYLGQWKEVVANNPDLDGHEKSAEMGKIIAKFDDILTQDQKREQKTIVFRWLMFFLFFETIIVFGIMYMTDLDYLHMSLLIGATLAQITVIIYHIVKNLYPVDNAQVQALSTEYLSTPSRATSGAAASAQ